MGNKYISSIRGSAKSGQPNLLRQFQSGAADLLSNLQESTGFTQERVQNISRKSENNMALLEKDLEKLDTTLTIYNVTGVILGITGVVLTSKAIKDWIQGR